MRPSGSGCRRPGGRPRATTAGRRRCGGSSHACRTLPGRAGSSPPPRRCPSCAAALAEGAAPGAGARGSRGRGAPTSGGARRTRGYHHPMRIDALREHWEAYGRSDPLWAVLSEPGLQGNRWDLEEFLRRGEVEVQQYLGELDEHRIEVRRGRALDFGCGVGRLTQALGERFERWDGLDIAASMVEQARRVNRHGDRCRYHVNPASDLRLFESETFDFVLSIIVLQHMEPHYAKGYIAEFLRVLRPGGIALFQLPTGHKRPERALPDGAWRASLHAVQAPRELAALEAASIQV